MALCSFKMTKTKKKYFRVFRQGYKVHLCTRKKSDGRYRSLCGRCFWEHGDLLSLKSKRSMGTNARGVSFCSKTWKYEWWGKTLVVRISKRSR